MDSNIREINSLVHSATTALFHISEVANDYGMEALLLVASKTGIEMPQADLTPADLALLIWLHDPDQLRRAIFER